jgi:alpha-mannosidase
LAVRSDHVTAEAQFGLVTRPTHTNTAWDVARFEAPCQRFVDLSEPNFGVALLTDSKHGYSSLGSMLKLSLLRSPVEPDPRGDAGEHRFRYALAPHAGSVTTAGVVRWARAFSDPVMVAATGAEPSSRSMFSVDHPGVQIDTVKPAESGSDVIVRLYEAHGDRSRVRLRSSLPFAGAARTDLLERDSEDLDWADGSTSLELGPFEVVSIRLRASP